MLLRYRFIVFFLINLKLILCQNVASFDYLALNEGEHGMQNGLEYKYVLDTQDLNNKEALLTKSINDESIILIESNRTKRDLDDLTQNLRLLTANSNKSKSLTVSSDFCLFSNIKPKLNECFAKSDDCKVILDCIASFNLVELCKLQNMYTPTIWILNIYEILRNENFCSFPIECAIIPSENEYLRKLSSVLSSVNEYGPAYLNQPKADNKKYCSKSHHLVNRVRDAFDIFDMCFEITEMNRIKDLIEETSDLILDRNCRYCISHNIVFDMCFIDRYDPFNSLTCHEAYKCVQDRIATYQCNLDPDYTPLKLITSFVNNMTNICNLSTNNSKNLEYVREWFLGIDVCLKERHHIGLTFSEAPPNLDFCGEIEDTYQCIKSNYRNMFEALPQLRKTFEFFSKDYNRLQRSCDVFSLSKLTTTPTNYFTRHPYVNNSEQTILEDDKVYYHETVIRAELDQSINWIDLDSPQFALYEVKRDHDLSKNYLKATIVKLKFKFPYYGHLLDQIVVATGGFLYVGSLMNPLITKAQYIAPLMANFDPTLSNTSMIKYVDNSTHFICTWENLRLQDQPENGDYTFQVVLNNEGQIMFNYKRIPNGNISNFNHTVKIGLSDAYIYYRLISKSKIEYTIVQYHVVSVSMDNIKTGNSIILFMLPNCIQFKTCDTCVNGLTNFKCIWCPALQRCSDTVDRYRQEWVEYSCPMNFEDQANSSCLLTGKANSYRENTYKDRSDLEINDSDNVKSVLFGVFMTLILSMVITTLAWTIYAYKNPTSPSGIWLIEHRPRKYLNHLKNRFDRNTSNLTRLENSVA
ncbi:unnamed protein product [Brachionus calyciflorus]|uniref:Uncharacterized protein n=1 Tax=Brachionus calyciflorus TaxID=104777 RepID=A0A813ZJJ6_9BILA|nr:unnamed protein product [Brachionus calyciflorus]